ncbi:mCG146904 [Mus musculus]|nr:mCG146904 [Mus musculus]
MFLCLKRREDVSKRLARFKLMSDVKGPSASQGRWHRKEEICTLRGLAKRQKKSSSLACCFGPIEGKTLEL